ncbi:Dolichyl-diphosphooligosaccharide--protein [Carex littledalei]|uniref:Dolichyl-diphosphooligosaccharide--protein glycosyltransferase subunit 2 n=1 Tax=Carex littledalei TaxID=544730 RepID=A0A833VDK9_9POAL|nr:Dolichyl-diphosphooligosaccharide--protein [Carex littledalei]
MEQALSQSDGTWRYDTNSPGSSTFAAGIALEALASVVSLAGSDIDQSKIAVVKKDINKLFDRIKRYNDGTLYFDEKNVDPDQYKGPLGTSASVVSGVSAFAAVSSEKLNIGGEKILGLAKFFLSIGVPGVTKDFFYQINSLASLENNRVSVPLILSLPATVLSLTSKDQLKVEVTTVFGSPAPPLTVSLLKVLTPDSKEVTSFEKKELEYDPENRIHFLDISPLKIDVGKYSLIFEVSMNDPELAENYATGGQISVTTFLTGNIKIDKAEIAISDSDASSESVKKLDLSKDSMVSLSANHLQKMRLSLQLKTPLGKSFKPHQLIVKLQHESKVEHLFVPGMSSKQYKLVLNFLGLVEKFYYLSGRYNIELAIGDAVMENSLLWSLGSIELDLPEAPEKAPKSPAQPVDPLSRFGPKEEISHIFRAPEKRPPQKLSLIFTGLTLLPLLAFLIGLLRIGVNFKGFPSSAVPASFAVLFHGGIGAFIPNEAIKSELRDADNLTEERLDEIVCSFLNDFKTDNVKGNTWPTDISAYTVSISAYTRILARKHTDLCINCVNPGYVVTDITWNTGQCTVEEGAKGPVMLALALLASTTIKLNYHHLSD